MAQFGNGQTQMCDYCHQKPKFPPYNYCGKGCGSKARATGGTASNNNNPTLCKQCGQRPVHRGHQFCGRNCANTWQAANGQINTGGGVQPQHGQQSWNAMPPPQTQNPPAQSFNQGGGDGGRLRGFVKNLKGLVSQGHQFQQPQPQQQQQHTSPDPTLISPPITPTPSGTGGSMSSGMSTPITPGLNQQYHTPPSPPSPGVQDLNANSHMNGHQKSKTMAIAMSPVNSTGSDDPNFDPQSDLNHDPTVTSNHHQNTAGSVPIQAQAQLSIQVGSPQPTGTGGHGNGNWDPSDPNNFPSQQSASTCRLNGCNKPAYVDPVTRRQGEYCSQRHREDATFFGQVNPCIMCLKMPRGPNDHFCSRACRDKALRP